MAFSDSVGILMRIKADSSDAQTKIKAFKADLNDLDKEVRGGATGLERLAASSGLSASQFSSLTSAASIVGAGILAVSAAAIGGAVALFKLTVAASEYGSLLFDAAKKTGLSAAAISTLKFNADNAGSSLEQISGSVAKFNVLLGQAENGNKKAIATLEQYGISAKDTDTAFAQAIKRISEMDSASQKAAATTALFKDRTGELLPVIDQMNGKFFESIEAAHKLGITLTEEDLKAADDFGDTLGLLGTQAKVLAAKFTLEFAPQITKAMQSISTAMSDNKETVSDWGQSFEDLIVGAQRSAPVMKGLVDLFLEMPGPIEIATLGILNYSTALDIATLGASAFVRAQREAYNEFFTLRKQLGKTGIVAGIGGLKASAGGSVGKELTSDDPDSNKPNIIKVPRADNQRDFDQAAKRYAEQQAREAERIERERIARIKENIATEIAEKRASIATLIGLEKQRFSEGILSEQQYIENIRQQEMLLTGFIIDAKNRELEAVKGNAGEEKRLNSEIKILNAGRELQLAGYAENDAKRKKDATEVEKKLHEQRVKNWKEHIENLVRIQELEDAEQERKARELASNARDQIESGGVTTGGGVGQGLANSLGINLVSRFGDKDEILSDAEFLKNVAKDIETSVGQSLGALANGLANLAVQWITTGKVSAKAALQMAAGVAIGLAIEAGMKALFQYAEGMAALANPLTAALAPGHFAAAKAYGVVAAIAGGAGLALAGGARAAGGNQRGSQAFAGQTSNNAPLRGPGQGEDGNEFRGQFRGFGEFNSRVNAALRGMAESTDRQNQVIGRLDESVEAFTTRVTSVPAGEIFAMGAEENPGAVGKAYRSELENDGRATTQQRRLTGDYR